jgi:hypothetical protein
MAYPYDDIYSQIMSRFQQQEPYYNFNPYGSNFTGGYDPTLYYRLVGGQAVPGGETATGMNRGSGLLGDAMGPSAPSTTVERGDPNSLTGGLLGFLMNPMGTSTGNISDLGTFADFSGYNAVTQSPFGSYAENVAPTEAAMGYDTAGFGSYGENVAPSVTEASKPGSYESSYDPSNPTADYGGDSGGGGGGGKIICTKLHELGKMPYHIFKADQDFGAKLVKESPETYDGYVVWARHVVRWMSRDDLIGKGVVAITNAIATPWSVAMAEQMGVNVKSGWFGRFLLKRGLQVCQMIGKMNQRSLQNV